MSILRASRALRQGVQTLPKRGLAIKATVKTAPDTSAMTFPAPSHVGLASSAAELARQLTAFYANPDSVIKLDEEARQALQADIAKKIASIPETPLNEMWAEANVQVPPEIRLGDNPYFEVFKDRRAAGKLE